MAGAEVKHDYHLVNPSPVAAVRLGRGDPDDDRRGRMDEIRGPASRASSRPSSTLKGNWLFLLGFVMVLITMVGWWRDVIKESLTGENTSTVVRLGLRYGMVLFIASEVMFFAAWFWAFFGAALFPTAFDPVILTDGAQMTNAAGEPAFHRQ